MSGGWTALRRELAIWRDADRDLPVWWRDDDAIADTPALRQLTQTADRLGLPVHLAVIPDHARASLVEAVARTPTLIPMVHGWAHANHAQPSDKKAEFGRPRPDAKTETAAALARMRHLFADRLLPVFVPPWNRIAPEIVAHLAAQGYAGLSTHTPRASRMTQGLAQINTHVDPIFWRGGGGLADPESTLAGLVALLQDRRSGRADATEPLGVLTHHLVHDRAIWDFSERLLDVLLAGGARPVTTVLPPGQSQTR